MAEAIHCPSCTTRYRLRPERLRPAMRRAKCFTCGNIFPVGDVVQRLLAPPAPATTAAFRPDLVAAKQHEPTDHAALPTPSVSLNDLGGSDPDILEKTLVTVPEFLPEAKAEAFSPSSPEITETTLSGYSSARDAIEKLFGDTPPAASTLRVHTDSSSMDMEATLSALENTLGVSPAAPATEAQVAPGLSPTTPEISGEDLAGSSTSTLRLSQQDLLAALAAAPVPAPTPAPASAPIDATVQIRAADVLATRPAVPRAFAPFSESPDAGAELLRLKIGDDIYGGLTMPQLISWVTEGRILENHLVARQISENWLEAQKVPGLRPVFERLRRERAATSAPSLDSVIPELAPKKSLFGGLFGKH